MAITTIPVSKEIRDRLKRLASKGETYDALLRRMIRKVEAKALYERERRILEREEFLDPQGLRGILKGKIDTKGFEKDLRKLRKEWSL